MEHRERAEELEAEAEEMSRRSEALSDEIEGTQAGWESKEADESVPGAQPPEEAGTGSEGEEGEEAEE